jgi:hypothetical protein
VAVPGNACRKTLVGTVPAIECLGRPGRKSDRAIKILYQLEYHMKTTRKSFLAGPSAAAIAAAVLGFWLSVGGAQVVRAEDAETLASPGQDMVLMPVKAVHALEQRVIYLEETVAALTESWQHINTHRLCVSDDSGAETCITKAQLDFLLTKLANAQISQPAVSQEAKATAPAEPVEMAVTAEISQPAVSQEAKAAPSAEPIETAATAEPAPLADPVTVVGENVLPAEEPEITGTVSPAIAGDAITGPAVLSYPNVEIYEEPVARVED